MLITPILKIDDFLQVMTKVSLSNGNGASIIPTSPNFSKKSSLNERARRASLPPLPARVLLPPDGERSSTSVIKLKCKIPFNIKILQY